MVYLVEVVCFMHLSLWKMAAANLPDCNMRIRIRFLSFPLDIGRLRFSAKVYSLLRGVSLPSSIM